MNSFLDKPGKKFSKIIIGITILLTVILLLNLFNSQIANSLYLATNPLQKVFWESGSTVSNFLQLFSNKGKLVEKNDELSKQNQQLLQELSGYYSIKIENQELRKVIDQEINKEFKLILVDIVGLNSSEDSILISKGSEDGISENMPVVNSEKVIFGKVSNVYKNFSKVILISENKSALDVKILKDDTVSPPIYGAAKGQGNQKVYLDLIPMDREIKKGDMLISSSLEGLFPKNLLVGEITEVQKDDLKPFQTAEIKPFFNFNQTDKLFVITDYLNQ